MEKIKMVAPCLFGVEGIAADEFRRMGFEEVTVEDGRVLLSGDYNMLARANINSRFAERILILLGEFNAISFTELFDGVKALPWEDFIGRDDAFPVNGHSINSALFSIPDCQSIIKKAIVERLRQKYNVSWFEETGPEYRVRFSIHKDKVSLMIDTSGEGLHKRGYRRNSNDAPLKETLGAAMCDLARIYPDTLLFDPMCGSGTLLIEAALMATKTASGLRRSFAAERFGCVPQKAWQQERMRAQDLIIHNVDFRAQGFDIDEKAVQLTLANAKKAGVEKYVKAAIGDVCNFTPPDERCLIITNPPYGERLLDVRAAEQLYKTMGERFIRGNGRKYFIISPHDEFEKHFGADADKRRKLYNGMIKCQLFMYFKSDFNDRKDRIK
ncbi:MAG: class I SAM-dependent RNA methyltransferase [Ruminococcaceae bacterium]|nr:class I SAM-dependent RNA methyltransferase [Oscillospiraceae bacterium]